MDILTEAYKGLFPDREPEREMKLKYSGKFAGYNANVRYTLRTMEFHLSRDWKEIDRDIKIGLIQSLMQKAFRKERSIKITTTNIEMYNIFIKKIHVAVPITETDPELSIAFEKVNLNFFSGMIGPTNLKWGNESRTKFGSYTYARNLITINPILKENSDLLEFVLFHEMLHKKIKFTNKGMRSYHHTTEFRTAEKSYPDYQKLEVKLRLLSRNATRFGQRTVFGRGGRVKKVRKFFNWF